jgi:hypothetical protein
VHGTRLHGALLEAVVSFHFLHIFLRLLVDCFRERFTERMARHGVVAESSEQLPPDELTSFVFVFCPRPEQELKESFNYGLFYPPSNGRAGKFLDDERPLSDYPFNGPLGYLEVSYKNQQR